MMPRPEARTRAHQEGFQLLKSGAYQDAQRVLSETIELHGSNISLHSDLAQACFLAGDIKNFRLNVARLEREFHLARPLLYPRNRVSALLSLSKFNEELGKIHQALEQTEQALQLCSEDTELLWKVRAHKLQLLADFGTAEEFIPLYRACLQSSEKNPEILGITLKAIIMVEARHFGLETAWPHFLELSKHPELDAAILRACVLSLLEFTIEKDDEARRLAMLEYLSSGEGLGHLDAYQGELFLLARLPRLTTKDEDFERWSSSISPLCQVRLFALEAQRPMGFRDLARNRLSQVIETTSAQDRELLKRKWPKVIA